MTTPAVYLDLSDQYERAAQQSFSPASRIQLQTIAGTYKTLARSMLVLEESSEALKRLQLPRK